MQCLAIPSASRLRAATHGARFEVR